MGQHWTNPDILEKQLVWDYFQRKTDGFFVEVGANDPKEGSQTWLLEQNGWRGILIEPLSRFCEALCAHRLRSQVFRVACGPPGHPPSAELYEAEHHNLSTLKPHAVDARTKYVRKEEVPVLTLDEVLAKAGNPQVDFVSIDVEGAQFEVLQGFDLARHRPALLLVEDHLHDWKTHLHVSRCGYRLVKRTGLNSWYVPKERAFRSTLLERLKLWRKVWPGTPARKLKFCLSRRRAGARS